MPRSATLTAPRAGPVNKRKLTDLFVLDREG